MCFLRELKESSNFKNIFIYLLVVYTRLVYINLQNILFIIHSYNYKPILLLPYCVWNSGDRDVSVCASSIRPSHLDVICEKRGTWYDGVNIFAIFLIYNWPGRWHTFCCVQFHSTLIQVYFFTKLSVTYTLSSSSIFILLKQFRSIYHIYHIIWKIIQYISWKY